MSVNIPRRIGLQLCLGSNRTCVRTSRPRSVSLGVGIVGATSCHLTCAARILRTNLADAELGGAELAGAILAEADLGGAHLAARTSYPARLTPSVTAVSQIPRFPTSQVESLVAFLARLPSPTLNLVSDGSSSRSPRLGTPPGVASRSLRQPRPWPPLARGSAAGGSGGGNRTACTWLTTHGPDDRRSRPEISAERLNHPAARYVFRAGQVSPLAPRRALSSHPASTGPAASRGQGRLSCVHHSRHC